ncbi:MAG: hypothetical protein APF78_06385 [Sphingomonadales bacterium BRH_c3]|nr:MAG: hypothetical protein APF78_06385 [Sphingomonadales bacterium BRH_c3]
MNLPGWTREPLVHFLLAGILIFGLFSLRGEEVDPASRTIDVDREQLAQLSLVFERTMGRAPTDAELDQQIENYIRDEVLYREALRLGLDQGDAVVRRRMAQKMDMIASARAETARPDDGVLRKWYAENGARFAPEVSYTFDQLWFEAEGEAQAGLARLRSGSDWRRSGGEISLPASVDAKSRREVLASFGELFLVGLDRLEPSSDWQGPVPSGLGWHLVRLERREPGKVPPFEDIREQVENDWRTATIAARKEAAYDLLRSAYNVKIER